MFFFHNHPTTKTTAYFYKIMIDFKIIWQTIQPRWLWLKVYWARLVNPTIQANTLKHKLKQYIGVDFLLLESQTSYLGFEFPAIAGRTNLAEEPWFIYYKPKKFQVLNLKKKYHGLQNLIFFYGLKDLDFKKSGCRLKGQYPDQTLSEKNLFNCFKDVTYVNRFAALVLRIQTILA